MNLTFQFTARDVWQAQLADCANANVSIDFENYIFTDSGIGREFLNIFKTKAKSGVRVRLLLDMFGSLEVYQNDGLQKELRESGVELAFFNPIAFWRLHKFFDWFSRRDHRKLMLIDNRIAHIGSANIDESMRNWYETSARILDAEVESVGQSFDVMWNSALRGTPTRRNYRLELMSGLEYVSSTPHIGKRSVHRELLRMIRRAKHSIVLVSPYFIPTERLQRALHRTLKRGVKVELLVTEAPSSSKVIVIAGREYARALARRGASVRVMPRYMHDKFYIIDGDFAMMGSANIDSLSMLSDYEHVLMGEAKNFVAPLITNYIRLWSESELPPAISWRDRLLGMLTRPIHRFL